MHLLTIDREHRTNGIPFDRVFAIVADIDAEPRRHEVVHQTSVVDLLHTHPTSAERPSTLLPNTSTTHNSPAS